MKRGIIYTIATDAEYLNMDSHIHLIHQQLIYMIKGTLRVKMEHNEYFLPEGFIGIVPAGRLHSLHSRNEKVKMFLIYYPPHVELQEFTSLNSNDFIIENMRYISKLSSTLRPHSEKIFYDYVVSFLYLLQQCGSQHLFPVKGLIAPKNERLIPVIKFLNEHFKEDNTLSEIAARFGFTIRNLTRLLKSENISFNNYLNYIRVIHAIEMFSDSHDNIESVAYQVGYNTASNFSRVFKKYTGIAPRDFIKENTTKSIYEHLSSQTSVIPYEHKELLSKNHE